MLPTLVPKAEPLPGFSGASRVIYSEVMVPRQLEPRHRAATQVRSFVERCWEAYFRAGTPPAPKRGVSSPNRPPDGVSSRGGGWNEAVRTRRALGVSGRRGLFNRGRGKLPRRPSDSGKVRLCLLPCHLQVGPLWGPPEFLLCFTEIW